MKRRILSVLIISLMLTSFVPSIHAEHEIWDGSVATEFSGGNGTADAPYEIKNGAELALLARLVNQKNTAYQNDWYVLTADIYLNDTSDWKNWLSKAPKNEWKAIGDNGTSEQFPCYFSGNFDGDFHTVYGIYMNNEDYGQGLFGVLKNATVEHLRIRESYIHGHRYVGSIAGLNWCTDAERTSFVHGCINEGDVRGTGNTGGIVGHNRADGGVAEISECENSGYVLGYNCVGGIVGWNEANELALVGNCANHGTVNGGNHHVGGVVGENRAKNGSAVVRYCYNTGKTTGGADCYYLGGVIGLHQGNSDTNPAISESCYYLLDSAPTAIGRDGGHTTIRGVQGLTQMMMQGKSAYQDFDFEFFWTIDPKTKLPTLTAWQDAFSDEIKVYVNGKRLTFDQPPILQNDRTLVPMRAIFEALGASLDWNSEISTATAVRNDITVSVTIGKAELMKNGVPVPLDVLPTIQNSRTLIPLRAVAESFSCSVSWDGNTKTVSITE